MNVSEAIRRLEFKAGTIDDITNHSINKLFTNQQLADELNTQLEDYARITKGIQDIYSTQIQPNAPFIQAPSLALRSEAYKFIGVIRNGVIFPADMRGMRDVYKTFRYSPMNGITNWVMPWSAGKSQYLSMFPTTSSAANSTTLTAGINSSATTIPVTSTVGFMAQHGRLTIGSEKILYQYKDLTNFYNCVRGVEMTTAAAHSTNDTVTENNIFILYCRLPIPITVEGDGTFSAGTLAQVLEPCEEHMQGIIKAAAYNLILKIDGERAKNYQIDSNQLYGTYELEILRGYYAGRQGTNIDTESLINESGVPFGTNLIY